MQAMNNVFVIANCESKPIFDIFEAYCKFMEKVHKKVIIKLGSGNHFNHNETRTCQRSK